MIDDKAVEAALEGKWAYWEALKDPMALTDEHEQNAMRAALTAALPFIQEECIPAVVKNDEAGISELIIRDGPNFTAGSIVAWPVFDMATKEIIGFRWETGAHQEGWQPIGSAPKDGSRFIAWIAEERAVDFVHWQDFGRADSPVGWRDGFIQVYPDGDPDGPTHWRPLPEAPK